MEKPPTLPDAKPPLGGAFYFALSLPLVAMAITAALVDHDYFFIPVLGISALTMLVCSAFLAMRLARRFSKTGEAGVGMTILMFIAVQGFYGVCFFLGFSGLAFFG